MAFSTTILEKSTNPTFLPYISPFALPERPLWDDDTGKGILFIYWVVYTEYCGGPRSRKHVKCFLVVVCERWQRHWLPLVVVLIKWPRPSPKFNLCKAILQPAPYKWMTEIISCGMNLFSRPFPFPDQARYTLAGRKKREECPNSAIFGDSSRHPFGCCI